MGIRITGAFRLITMALSICLLIACDPGTLDTAGDTGVPAAPRTSDAGSFRLPVSLNEVMVALVNHAADPIWRAAWRNPESDRDWRNLEYEAYQLQLAGALLVIPGNGPMDETWTSNPQWAVWAGRLEAAGGRAVSAIGARDLKQISRAGDDIVDVCEGCHLAFKPDLPTSGLFGELSPTAADFEDPAEDDQP